MAFLNNEQLKELGLASFGENVLISDKATIYNPKQISIGSNVRIDDFCVLSAGDGGIEIGDYIHIAVFCTLIGSGKITLEDFANLSSRVSIYSSNDDYSGEYMTNPMVPKAYTGVVHAGVHLGRHVIVGSGSIILPGVSLEDGVAVGALSLINKNCEAFGIYFGNPAQRVKGRKRNLLRLEQQFLGSKLQ
ncbi:MAG: acyltransferase [Desulfobulbaceae bacterium]|nr:acyltransferase [Desulfobulbaceae bacterium]